MLARGFRRAVSRAAGKMRQAVVRYGGFKGESAMAARIFLGLFGAMWLGYGVWCFTDPGYLREAAGIAFISTTGNVDLRATYGGLQMAIGLLLLGGALRAVATRTGAMPDSSAEITSVANHRQADRVGLGHNPRAGRHVWPARCWRRNGPRIRCSRYVSKSARWLRCCCFLRAPRDAEATNRRACGAPQLLGGQTCSNPRK